VTDTGADGVGEILFLLLEADTALFTSPYWYWFDVVLTNNDVQDVESGMVLFMSGPAAGGALGVDHIDLTPGTTQGVVVDDTRQFTAAAKDSANVTLPGVSIRWAVSDSSIGRITADGFFTALAEGSVKVIAYAGDVASVVDVTVSVDDVGLLVTDIGGDAFVDAIYDGRFNVKAFASSPTVGRLQEDARVRVSGLTNMTELACIAGIELSCDATALFNANTKATFMYWARLIPRNINDAGIVWRGGANDNIAVRHSHGPAADDHDQQLRCYFEAANYGEVVISKLVGAPFKVTWVYDGAGATNADRLKCYIASYDRATDTFGADVAQVVAFTGAIPASIAASTGTPGIGNGFWGAIDEIRLWAGTALSFAQVQAHTLAAVPTNPNIRYEFKGVGTNTGATAGNHCAPGADAVFTSGVYRYGALRTLNSVAYDSAVGALTFNGVDDNAVAGGPWRATDDLAVVVVGTITPTNADLRFVAEVYQKINVIALNISRSATPSALQTAFASVSPSVDVSAASGIRVFHGRRTREGGVVRTGARLGSGAEVSGTGAVAALSPYYVVSGTRSHYYPDYKSEYTERALLILAGAYLTAKQDIVNTWAQLRRGATL
jgi:hypothetical protein